MSTAILDAGLVAGKEDADRRAEARPAAWSRWELLVVGLVLALELFYFSGILGTDDLTFYFKYAWDSLHGRLAVPGPDYAFGWHFFVRFVHWKLMELAIALFPGQSWAVGLPSLLASVVILLVLRSLARRDGQPRWAALAMLIGGLVPFQVFLASTGLAYVVASAIAWTGVYIAAGSFLEQGTRHAGWRCLFGGLLVGCAYNAHEMVAVFVPGLILFVLLCRTRQAWAWRRAGCLVLGAGIWLVFEAALLWALTGNPLHHINAGPSLGGLTPVAAAGMTWRRFLWDGSVYLRWLMNPMAAFGPMGLLMLGGILYALWKRSPFASLLLCLVLPALIYLSVGTRSLRQYQLPFRYPLYLIPLVPGLALLAARMVWAAWQKGVWARRVVLVLGVLCVGRCLVAPNEWCGLWMIGADVRAGYQLVQQDLPEVWRNLPAHDGPIRLLASHRTWARFNHFPKWLDCPQVELIKTVPRNTDEWIDLYGGSYVLVSRYDRFGTLNPRHQPQVLFGPSMDSLRRFELVAHREPTYDRLHTVAAWLTRQPAPTRPRQAVQLWRVPTRAEWPARG